MNTIHKYIKLSFAMVFMVLAAASASVVLQGADVSANVGDKGCESETSIISCEDRLDSDGNVKEGVAGTGLWSVLLLALNVLIGGIGVVALGGIVFASAQYASAGGNQEQVKRAGAMIRNIVLGVIIFALMWSALNFLIPGGVFTD